MSDDGDLRGNEWYAAAGDDIRGSAANPTRPYIFERVWPMAAGVLELCWQPGYGYCTPNLTRYPWQWLWDSAFHSIIWAALGDERAEIELRSLFAHQTDTGFLPHMGYQKDPATAEPLWGVRGRSTITQPPMFGHAIRELVAEGYTVDDQLQESAIRAIRFLADNRRGPHGLVGIVHPWESGADNCPRWDEWCGTPFEREAWMERKLQLMASLRLDRTGAAVANSEFEVYPASFNALVAFNAEELAKVTGNQFLTHFADELKQALDQQWDAERVTWADVDREGKVTSTAQTLDALFPILVTPDEAKVDAVTARILDRSYFDAPFGPTAVAQTEPSFDPAGYWRGPSWPQLSYLIWLGLSRRNRTEAADAVMSCLVSSVVKSGFAEYIQPFTGEGFGAQPQSWSGLAVVPYRLLARNLHGPSARRPDELSTRQRR